MDAQGRAEDPTQALLDVVRQTCRDLHGESSRRMDVGLDSQLDRDLGLDSLARVELLLRIEKKFRIRLAEDTLAVAGTPRDLLEAIRRGTEDFASSPLLPERAPASPDAGGEPAEAKTLLDVIEWHVRRHPARVQIIHASAEGEREITYGELLIEASTVAARLRRLGVQEKQAVALMLPTGTGYFHAYFGTLVAGGVPVPIYPPARLAQIEEHVRRHAGILANARAVALVTVREAMPAAILLKAIVPGLREVVSLEELSGERVSYAPADVGTGDVAFIQYTSGSTGNPKGVVLTHANLLANIRAIGKAVRIAPDDVFVSWLPLYHDMGLIAAWLASLYYGNRFVVLSPLAFLARPSNWMKAIHRHRGTLTAAPNFAYELCVKRIEESEMQGLDLSSLRLAANGAEPVNPETMERFIARFEKYGFRRGAMAPVYGLAEATVGLLVPPLGRGPLIDCIDRKIFERLRRAVPVGPKEANPLRFAACGKPLPGHRIRIVDKTGKELDERVEGRLEFQGPSATRGYLDNAEETRRLVKGEWLDTGDRAYVAAGEVYVTGRVKDIIIRGGRNIYPHEIEEVVGVLPGVRKGCVAAFGCQDPATGTEKLVLLAETRERDAAARDDIRRAIVQAVTGVLGEPPEEVVLAPPHTVLKTSSGKIRRAASRELYEAGLVGAPLRSVWWQMARLGVSGAFAQAGRALSFAGRVLYGVYFGTVFVLLAPPVWLVSAVLPRAAWTWRLSRAAARLLFGATGIALRVEGVEKLPTGPYILVANHASYLDGIVMVAALPKPHRFVAKRELLDNFVSRIYLRRLGAEFVERAASAQGVADANRMASAARSGPALAVFPEGTFRRAPGVLAFRLGAFAAAVKAAVPTVPVALRGTRSLLADGQWLPRRGAIAVHIGEPIAAPEAVADEFTDAVKLRDVARAAIVRQSGEADAGHSP